MGPTNIVVTDKDQKTTIPTDNNIRKKVHENYQRVKEQLEPVQSGPKSKVVQVLIGALRSWNPKT